MADSSNQSKILTTNKPYLNAFSTESEGLSIDLLISRNLTLQRAKSNFEI